MKTRLTKEQCGHLVDLGLHSNKWTSFRNEEGFNETYEYFALADLLEILPKVIKNGEREGFLNMGFNFEYEWQCFYSNLYPLYDKDFFGPELIDALYELACWYYGEFKK